MVTKDDLRRAVLAIDGCEEVADAGYSFTFHGRIMIWPYPERVHPKKARVPRFDQYVWRVADLDDKEALIAGEPDVFFTTDHYNGYHTVIVRLDAIDHDRLHELVRMAADAAPLPLFTRRRSHR